MGFKIEFKKGPLSVIQLIVGALKTANQAFGAAVALYVFIGCLIALLTAIIIGVLYVFSVHPAIWLPFYVVGSLLIGFISVVASLAIIQLLGSVLEKTGTFVVESFTSSVIPAAYFIVSSLIITAPVALILGAAYLSHSTFVMFIATLVVGISLLPFVFLPQTLALRGEGPIAALIYSWDLFRKHYIKVLATLFSMLVLLVLVVLGFFCVLKTFAPDILFKIAMMGPRELVPFVTSGQVALPVAIVSAIVSLCLQLYIFLTGQSLVTLLFLNLDYCHRSVSDLEDLPTISEEILTTEQIPNVAVKQASITTHSDENTSEHLEQVYEPSEHLDKAINVHEDRMPTLYFDETITGKMDDAARKIQELQANQTPKNSNEDDRPIKMSNNTL